MIDIFWDLMYRDEVLEESTVAHDEPNVVNSLPLYFSCWQATLIALQSETRCSSHIVYFIKREDF